MAADVDRQGLFGVKAFEVGWHTAKQRPNRYPFSSSVFGKELG